MMKHYRQVLFLVCCCFFGVDCCGQAIENVRATLEGENLVVTYDLLKGIANEKFSVSLRSSHDNFTMPLAQLSGDVGDNVLPGKDKRVVWALKNELPADFDADVVIKVTANLLALPLTVHPLTNTTVKKGQSIALNWQGGRSTDKINISLLKEGVPQKQLANGIPNSQQFQYAVPANLKGSGYSFKISTAKEEAITGAFRVKSKVKAIFIILPVAVVGVAAVFLGGGKTENGGTTPTAEELPGPLKPSN